MLSDAPAFRKHVAGYSLRLGPLLILISLLVRPEWSWDAATVLDNVAADRDAQLIAALLGLIGAAILIPAILGLMHLLRGRHPAWAHIGGPLASLGAIVLVFGYSLDVAIWQMAGPRAPGEETVALVQRLFDEPLTAALLRYLPALLAAGLVILAIGLRLARAGDPWSFYFLIVGSVLATYGSIEADRLFHILGWTLVFAATFAIGRRILKATEDDWAEWPAWQISWTRGN